MSIFQQLMKSTYSPKDIVLFRFQGIGKTILFVFLLTLISILPTVFYFSTAATSSLQSATKVIKNELPAFTIENGVLQSQQKTPITFEENGFTVIFDSSGSISRADLEDSYNAFGMLREEFVLVAGGQIQTYPYAMFSTVKINKDNFLSFFENLDQMVYVLLPLIFIFIYLMASAVKFIEVTMLALIGLLIKNLSKINIQYSQLWRISAYCITLPTIFFTIMAVLRTNVPNSFIITWFVNIIILYLVLNEMPKQKKKPSNAE